VPVDGRPAVRDRQRAVLVVFSPESFLWRLLYLVWIWTVTDLRRSYMCGGSVFPEESLRAVLKSVLLTTLGARVVLDSDLTNDS